MKVSIIMPAYNEAATIAEMIVKVQAVDVGYPKEIIIVDDASLFR
ncbi:MAG: glycosyltransferase [Nitrospira sp.]|nr:glycosyltransferase [Nitrospira sp.]